MRSIVRYIQIKAAIIFYAVKAATGQPFSAARLFFLFRGTLLRLLLFSSKTMESVRQHNCVLRFAVSDLIPLDFVRFQMKISACTVADIDRRVLRLVGIVDNAVLAVFHIGMHFNIIVG